MYDARVITLSEPTAGHKKQQVSLSEGLKKEHEKLFGNLNPRKLDSKVISTKVEMHTACFFSDSAEIFRKKYRHGRKTKNDIFLLLVFIAKQFEVEIEDVLSDSRKTNLVMSRKYFAFFCYYYLMKNHTEIAELINRERSTMVTSIQDVISDLECYARSRSRAAKIDKFLHNICARRKHEI